MGNEQQAFIKPLNSSCRLCMIICYTDLYTVTACTKGLSVYVHFQGLDSIWQIIPKLLFCYALNKQKYPPQATQTKPN